MRTPEAEHYDIAFIGLGAANSLLALRLHESGFLRNKRIVVIDTDIHSPFQRTFCFWSTPEEVATLGVESMISHSWTNIEIPGIASDSIAPLRYHHISGPAVRSNACEVLSNYNTRFINSFMQGDSVQQGDGFLIHAGDDSVFASQVFDSRTPEYLAAEPHQTHLLQSFRGWTVQLPAPAFDPSTMVLMDFRVPQLGATQFIYILPFSSNTALIELTRFGKSPITETEAHSILHDYIAAISSDYTVVSTEHGVIPMSTCTLNTEIPGPQWINTGARANLLKPSTGYAFHAMAEDAYRKAGAINSQKPIVAESKRTRFAFYDRLLLKILEEQPEQGRRIFESLFRGTSISTILHFLREKTTPFQEVKLFATLPVSLFLSKAVKEVQYRMGKLPTSAYGMILTLLFLLLSQMKLTTTAWTTLGVGFLFIGLSHGALDHLTDARITNTKMLARFMATYILKGILLGCIWMLAPFFALVVFILYSAWHFGQADFEEWRLKPGWMPGVWGLVVLTLILLLHFSETQSILLEIPGIRLKWMEGFSYFYITLIVVSTLLVGLIISLKFRSAQMVLTLAYVLLSALLPIVFSFGIYFIAQHSVNGWRHLKAGLGQDYVPLWIQSLPFSVGGAALIIIFMTIVPDNYFGIFFIMLSCLSVPHVISMHRFYKQLVLDSHK